MNMRTLLGLGAVLSVALGIGCYDPNYPANLRCGGTNLDKCPKDFRPVGAGTNCVCVKDGSALGGAGGGTGGVVGQGGAGGGGTGGVGQGGAGGMGQGGAGGGVGGAGGGGMCVGPVACTLASSQGSCDPACQKGCSCDQRCVIDNTFRPTCTTPLSPSELKPTYARCEVPPGKRVDNCQAGNVCLGEQVNPEQCGSHCYRVCRVDADCPSGAHCSQSLTSPEDFTPDCTKPGEICYCDNPNVRCNPIAMDATATCGRGPNYACYLAGARFPDETVCDCIGTKSEGEACAIERECKPGLVCVDANDGQMGKCRRVCPRAGAPNFCGAGRSCKQFFSSSMFGFCYP